MEVRKKEKGREVTVGNVILSVNEGSGRDSSPALRGQNDRTEVLDKFILRTIEGLEQ